MKIMDNMNDKRGINKKVVIGGLGGLVCIIAVVILVISLDNKKNDSAEVNDVNVAGNTSVDDGLLDDREMVKVEKEEEEAEDVNEEEETEDGKDTTGSASVASNAEKEIAEIVSYTSIKTDEASLIQLVKNTVKLSHDQFEEARKDEQSRTSVLLDSIEAANNSGNLERIFEPLGDSYNPLSEQHSQWTFMDAAGGLGYLIFNEKEINKENLVENELLKHFVANGVYNFDIDQLCNFEIESVMDLTFEDRITVSYDINFVVKMTYEGAQYASLIGNINNDYKILDVVKQDEINKIVNGKNLENLQVLQNSNTNDEKQPVNNSQAPTNDTPKESNNSNVNSNDPYVGMPGYEGPKEGYGYCPGIGYIKTDNSPGGNQNPDWKEPSWEEIENGEHRGDM